MAATGAISEGLLVGKELDPAFWTSVKCKGKYMKFNRSILVACVAALVTGAFSQTAEQPAVTLKVGDKAPKFEVAKWVQGKEFKEFKAGHVYVVEFWATWCGPCRVSIPHLSKLSEKYKGKVDIIGVNAFEVQNPKDNSYFPKVEKFVADMGAEMSYSVVIDGPAEKMSDNWMAASGQNGIPTAFIVNQQGQIAWIGHPMEMDAVLEAVVAGKYDLAKASKEADEQAAFQHALDSTMQTLQEAVQAGDYVAAVQKIDESLVKYPQLLEVLAPVKVNLQLLYDESKAFETIKTFANDKKIEKNADLLNSLAWMIVDPEAQIEKPDYKLALEVALKAAKASKYENGMILDTLALAYFKNKDKKKAIEWQTKAVALAEKDASVPEEMKAEMKARLEEFKKAK